MEELVTALSSTVDHSDIIRTPRGVLMGHTPQIAPLAYKHVLYAGLGPFELEAARRRYGEALSEPARDHLRKLNGARLFNGELSLRGYNEALRRDPADPLGQPVSLDYGNRIGRPKSLESDEFVFGALVQDEVSPLIVSRDGAVRLEGAGGEQRRWKTIGDAVRDLIVDLSSAGGKK